MDSTITRKGQIVIPSRLRKKFGIAAGDRIQILDAGDHIILKPITREYIQGLRGLLSGSGALQALEDERRAERERG